MSLNRTIPKAPSSHHATRQRALWARCALQTSLGAYVCSVPACMTAISWWRERKKKRRGQPAHGTPIPLRERLRVSLQPDPKFLAALLQNSRPFLMGSHPELRFVWSIESKSCERRSRTRLPVAVWTHLCIRSGLVEFKIRVSSFR